MTGCKMIAGFCLQDFLNLISVVVNVLLPIRCHICLGMPYVCIVLEEIIALLCFMTVKGV